MSVHLSEEDAQKAAEQTGLMLFHLDEIQRGTVSLPPGTDPDDQYTLLMLLAPIRKLIERLGSSKF